MMYFKRTVLCTVIALTLFGCDDKEDTATAGINAKDVAESTVAAIKEPVESPAAAIAIEATIAAVEEANAIAAAETPAVEAPAAVEVKEVEAVPEVKAEPVEAPVAAAEEKVEAAPAAPAEQPVEVQPAAQEQASVSVTVVKPEEVLEALPEVVEAPAVTEAPAVEEQIAEVKSDEAPVEAVTAAEPAAAAEPVAQDEDKPVASAEGVEEAVVEPAAEPAPVVEEAAPVVEPVAEVAPVSEAPAVSFAGDETSELVKNVKAYIYEGVDPTLTVGTALKTRQVCESTEWVQRVDRREREIAIYTCTHRGYEDYFDNLEGERLAAYVENAEKQLPGMQEKAKKAEEAFNSYSWYLAFVDQLKDQGLIDGLVDIQKKEGNGNRYLSYLINADKAGLLVGVSPEATDTYNGVFAVLDTMIGATETDETIDMADVHIDDRTKLYEDITSNGFQAFIDGIAKGGDVQAALNEADAKAKTLVDALEEANGQVETLEFQITNEGMENRLDAWNNDKPVNVVSTISFAMGKDRPYVVGCKLSFFTPDNPEVPAFIKTIDDAKTCLVENYREEYDAFYHNAFAQFYQSRVK